MPSNRKVVYTCITGNYDTLREVKILAKDVDYICFTDSDELTSNTWTIRKIPSELSHYSTVKQQRLIKILPHKYLSEYDLSLWVDSNIEIIDDVGYIFTKYDLEKNPIYINRHPTRDCIYREHIAVLRLKKDVPEITNEQINRYREEGFPEHYGMVESNIILRKHNNEKCKKLMEIWAEEIRRGSHRDQLSFNYAAWKAQIKYGILQEKYSRIQIADTAAFKLCRHTSNLLIAGITSEKIEEFKKHLEEAEAKAKEEERQDAIKKIVENNQKSVVPREDPLVSVVFFTHARTKCATNCLNFLLKNLKYPKLRWIISSDKSTDEHINSLVGEFSKYGISQNNITLVSTYGSKTGLPHSMNNGLKEAFKTGNLALRVEDDWLLWKPLFLKKYVDAFKNPNVCNIRLGALGGGGLQFTKYSDILKKISGPNNNAWIFNNQVALVNKAIYDKLGYYLVDCSSDTSELDFKTRYNSLTNFGKSNEFISLAPVEMKVNTLDDPSLWFIHVGRSELGHSYQEPKRYNFLYDEKPKQEKKEQKGDPTKLFKSLKKKSEEKPKEKPKEKKDVVLQAPSKIEQPKPKTETVAKEKIDFAELKKKIEELANKLQTEKSKNDELSKAVQEENSKNAEKDKTLKRLLERTQLLEKLISDLDEKKVKIFDASKERFFRIVIPTFNVEKYIEKCVESVEQQTFKDFQIIIVDDVSTDSTVERIKNLQSKYKNISSIFLKEKGYGGGARNAALDSDFVNSEYTLFLDGDDHYSSPNDLEKLYAFIKNKKYPDFIKLAFNKNADGVITTHTFTLNSFAMFEAPWTVCVRTNKCRPFVPNRKRFNDVVWHARTLDNCNSFAIFNEPIVTYNVGTNTNSVQYGKKDISWFKSLKDLVNDLKAENFKKSIVRNIARDNIKAKEKILEGLNYESLFENRKKYYFKIIIPNYNNEPYIRECLDSIMNQTFKDFVVIIVDDKSTDKSPEIAQEYAKKYKNVSFYKMRNKSYPGGCRNFGIEFPVESEYTLFVDGDDYYYNNMVLQRIYEQTNEKKPKCLLYGFYRDEDGKLTKARTGHIARSLGVLANSNWNSSSMKAVRSDYVQPFLEGCGFGEDTYAWLLLIDKLGDNFLNEIMETDEAYYVYRKNPTSITHTKNSFRDATKGIFHEAIFSLCLSTNNRYLKDSIRTRLKLDGSMLIKQ